MSPDDLDKVAALVSAQLATFAAEQKAARDELYKVLVSSLQASSEIADQVKGLQGEITQRTSATLQQFGAEFVRQVVPSLVAALPQQQATKSGLAEHEMQALVVALHETLTKRLAPITERLDSVERRTPRGHG